MPGHERESVVKLFPLRNAVLEFILKIAGRLEDGDVDCCLREEFVNFCCRDTCAKCGRILLISFGCYSLSNIVAIELICTILVRILWTTAWSVDLPSRVNLGFVDRCWGTLIFSLQ